MLVNTRIRRYTSAAIITVGVVFLYFVAKQINGVLPTDGSLLTQQPCAVPCWHGIIPGRSTTNDVYNIAANDSFISSGQHPKSIDLSKPDNTLYWWFSVPQDANRIIINNGVVFSIQIIPNMPFSILDIIKIYGLPTGVLINFENRLSEGEVYIQFSLYYPYRGLIVDFNFLGGKPNAAKYELLLTTLGRGFRTFPPASSMQDFVSETTGFKGTDLEKVMNTLIVTNWTGSNSIIIPPATNNIPILLLTSTPISVTPNP